MKMLLILLMLLAGSVSAQEFTALARVDPAKSKISDTRREFTLTLQLTQAVPFRVRSFDAPLRIEVEFSEVDFTGLSAAMLMQSDRITKADFDLPEPGWSRMVLELSEPMNVVQAGMSVSEETGQSVLRIVLQPVDKTKFIVNEPMRAKARPQHDMATDTTALPVVIIDPGHGGVDPGAEHGGMREATVMLALAIELTEAINRTGVMTAQLTREKDEFVSLQDRMTIARSASAVALLSLHADALSTGQARGASIYTLARESVSGASERMAERHGRSDLVSGIDLTAQDDRVADVLMDLARVETGPQGARLADAILDGLRLSGVKLHPRPRREGPLAVLNAPDFASVLIEVGYLSSAADRQALSDPQLRQRWIKGIVAGLIAWQANETIRATMVRQ